MTMSNGTDAHEGRGRTTISQAEAFQVLKLIETNGKVEDGYYVYNDGWSDDRIAAETGCPLKSVEYRRKEVFGPLRPGPGRGLINADTKEILTKLETLSVELKAARVEDYHIKRRLEMLEKTVNLLLQAPAKEHMQHSMKEQLQRLKEHYAKPEPRAQRPGADFNN